MNDTLTLDQLQIKRRELENELTELVQREQDLESNLKAREKAVIEELENIIANKKTMIETLESQNTSLNKTLNKLKTAPKQQEQGPSHTKTENADEQPEDNIQSSVIEEALHQTSKPDKTFYY